MEVIRGYNRNDILVNKFVTTVFNENTFNILQTQLST